MLCFYHNVWIFLSVRKEIHRKVTKLHRKNYTYARKYFPSIRINVIFSLRLAVSQQYKIKQAWRNRQTLWGGCTDANPKLLLNDT